MKPSQDPRPLSIDVFSSSSQKRVVVVTHRFQRWDCKYEDNRAKSRLGTTHWKRSSHCHSGLSSGLGAQPQAGAYVTMVSKYLIDTEMHFFTSQKPRCICNGWHAIVLKALFSFFLVVSCVP
jgi:hypothetical protein